MTVKVRIKRLTPSARRLESLSSEIGPASSFTSFADMLIAVMAFASALVTSRVLGAEGRGQLAAATSLIGVVYLIGNMGLGTANIYFAARGNIDFAALLGNSLVAAAVLGCLTAALAVSVVHLVPGILGALPVGFIYVGVVFLPIAFFEVFTSFLVIGRRRLFASNLLSVTARATATALVIASCIVSESAWVVFLIGQSYFVVRLVLNLGYMRRVGLLPRPTFDWEVLRTCLGYASRARGTEIFQHLNQRFDIFLINSLSSPTSVGIYSTAVVLSELSWYPAGAVGKVIFPHVAQTTGTDGQRIKQIAMSNRITLLLTLLLSAAIAVASFLAVTAIFGNEFAEARWIVILLWPGAVFFSVSAVLTASLAGLGFPHLGSLVAGTSFVVTLVLDLLLIPRFDIRGAAVASSLAYCTSAATVVYVFCRKTGARPVELLIPTRNDLTRIWSLLKSLLTSRRMPRMAIGDK